MKPARGGARSVGGRISMALVMLWWGPFSLAQVSGPAPAILSPEAASSLERVLDGEPLQELELRSRTFFFPTLQGGTLCVIGFRIGRAGLLFGARDEAGVDDSGMPGEVATLELFGALLHNGVEFKRLGTSFLLPRAAAGDDLSSPYSFAESLPAGSYELVWGIRDAVSGRATVRRDALDVPALGAAGIALSTVVVSADFSAAMGTPGPNTVSAGIRVLTASFDDDLERILDRQVTPQVALTFIVAGARFDPVTQGFNLEIDYRILDEQGRGVVRLPTQVSDRMTISQPIPIGMAEALESGRSYQFEITVRDLTAATEIVEHVPFRVRR